MKKEMDKNQNIRSKKAYIAPTFEIIDIEITQNILGDSKLSLPGGGNVPGDAW